MRATHECNTWVQQMSATNECNKWVQHMGATHECNTWVQQMSAAHECNKWVQHMSATNGVHAWYIFTIYYINRTHTYAWVCHTYAWVCHTYAWVVSHKWMSHAPIGGFSKVKSECKLVLFFLFSHFFWHLPGRIANWEMSYVTRINESCHT